MKAVMMSIQPYWVFLIIAKAMGWEIEQHKEIEVRKNYPKAENWNKVAKIYCSKDKKSFDKIPEKYRPAMKKFLGKVIGEVVCDRIEPFDVPYPAWSREYLNPILNGACLTYSDLHSYIGSGNRGYGWHISDLVIYDELKELSEFKNYCEKQPCQSNCWKCDRYDYIGNACYNTITRPPQSWCYVEE